MAVKVLLTWDISPDREQEYFEFVVGEFIPSVQRMGLQPVEAWATIFGPYPQIQVGLMAENATAVENIFVSEEWGKLQDQLFAFVNNYSYKIIPAKRGFQF